MAVSGVVPSGAAVGYSEKSIAPPATYSKVPCSPAVVKRPPLTVVEVDSAHTLIAHKNSPSLGALNVPPSIVSAPSLNTQKPSTPAVNTPSLIVSSP